MRGRFFRIYAAVGHRPDAGKRERRFSILRMGCSDPRGPPKPRAHRRSSQVAVRTPVKRQSVPGPAFLLRTGTSLRTGRGADQAQRSMLRAYCRFHEQAAWCGQIGRRFRSQLLNGSSSSALRSVRPMGKRRLAGAQIASCLTCGCLVPCATARQSHVPLC